MFAQIDSKGHAMTTVIATDEEFDFGAEAWDLIVVTYVKTLDEADAQRIERALRHGADQVYGVATIRSNAELSGGTAEASPKPIDYGNISCLHEVSAPSIPTRS